MPYETLHLDPLLVNATAQFSVGPYASGRIQIAVKSGGSATGAVYVVEYSLNGINWHPFAIPCTLFLSGMTRRLELDGIPFVRVRVATADSATGSVEATLYGNSNGGNLTSGLPR